MAKFKVGDKVRANQHTGVSKVYEGSEHIISSCEGVSVKLEDIDECYGFVSDWFDAISEPQYKPITPKVGERYRVLKNDSCLTVDRDYIVEKIEEDRGQSQYVRFVLFNDVADDGWWPIREHLTTEYLELVEEAQTITDGCYQDYGGANVVSSITINQTKKQTIMQTITTALKRVLSPQLQKFYKVGYIDTGLTLTSTGRQQYTEALFQNAGDHAKALTDMEALADEVIAEDKE